MLQREARAILVALGNDLAYVVQAVVSHLSGHVEESKGVDGLSSQVKAPNFVWKTTDFPAARKGMTWVLSLNVALSKPYVKHRPWKGFD